MKESARIDKWLWAVYAVDSAQVRSYGVSVLVHVLALNAHSVADKSDVGMWVDKARKKLLSACVKAVGWDIGRLALADGGYLAVFKANVADERLNALHCVYFSVVDIHSFYSLGKIRTSRTRHSLSSVHSGYKRR